MNIKIPYEIFTNIGSHESLILVQPNVFISHQFKGQIEWKIKAENKVFTIYQENHNSELFWGEGVPELFQNHKIEIENEITEYLNRCLD